MFENERRKYLYHNVKSVRVAKMRTNMMTYRKRKIKELEERIRQYEAELVALALKDSLEE